MYPLGELVEVEPIKENETINELSPTEDTLYNTITSKNITIIPYKDDTITKKTDKRISTLLGKLNQNKKSVTVDSSLFSSGLEDDLYASVLNIKNPIILVSEPADTLNYSYSINLCSIINDSNSNLNCIVYKAKNKSSKFSHIRKGLNKMKIIKQN